MKQKGWRRGGNAASDSEVGSAISEALTDGSLRLSGGLFDVLIWASTCLAGNADRRKTFTGNCWEGIISKCEPVKRSYRSLVW